MCSELSLRRQPLFAFKSIISNKSNDQADVPLYTQEAAALHHLFTLYVWSARNCITVFFFIRVECATLNHDFFASI